MHEPRRDEPVEAEWAIESGEIRLRLVLFRAGDRYAHRIDARRPDGSFATLIESVEGALAVQASPDGISAGTSSPSKAGDTCPTNDDLADRWPASPPYQQFHDQQIDGRRAWFLVGMAGKSHWSASVTESAERGFWEFDVACRYRDAPAGLGSTYRLAASIGLTLPSFGFRPSSAEQPPDEWFHGDWFGFAPRRDALAEPPASARWRYVCGFLRDDFSERRA